MTRAALVAFLLIAGAAVFLSGFFLPWPLALLCVWNTGVLFIYAGLVLAVYEAH